MGTNSFDNYMSAAAFAEAGEFDTARQMLNAGTGKSRRADEKQKPYLS